MEVELLDYLSSKEMGKGQTGSVRYILLVWRTSTTQSWKVQIVLECSQSIPEQFTGLK